MSWTFLTAPHGLTNWMPRSGGSSVKAMCKRFGLDEIKMDILDGYCDYVDCGGRCAPSKLKPLLDCVKTLPCSTAECERSFSAMNLIVFPSRTSPLLSHVSSLIVSSLMFIGLRLKQWNPCQNLVAPSQFSHLHASAAGNQKQQWARVEPKGTVGTVSVVTNELTL